MHVSKSELTFIRSLSQKKFREAEGKFVLEGWRTVNDALASSYKFELAVVLAKYLDNGVHGEVLDKLRKLLIQVKEITEKELNQVSETVHSQGILAVARQKKFTFGDVLNGGQNLIVLGDRIADPGNLGSIIRCCDWFHAEALILGQGCVELHSEKVVRSTAGSIFHLPVVEKAEFPAIFSQLKSQGFTIVATATDTATPYTDISDDKKIGLVLGAEASGVSQEVRKSADLVVKIPKFGQAESLNVGVTCGIILAHLRSKGKKGL